MIRSLAALIAALALAACVSVLPQAPPPAYRYLIAPVEYPVAATAGERVAWSLTIEDPMTTRVYDSTKIALIREPGRVEYYARGEWADRAPRLVQAALVRSFENSGRVLAVGERTIMPASDFVLNTDIRALYADYTSGALAARVEIYARLSDGRGRIRDSKLFTASARAKADTVPDVTDAFNAAVGEALRELIDWTYASGADSYAKYPTVAPIRR